MGGFQALPGRSRGLQGPPNLPGPQKPPQMNEKCALPRTTKASTLGEAEISCGMVRPARGSRGGF